MSVLASGTVEMKMKKPAPDKIIELVEEELGEFERNGLSYIIEFDGNWRLDSIIDALEVLNPYIETGSITYWSDEGEAYADFHDSVWCDEWQSSYYLSELPNSEVSSTERVAKILSTVADEMMSGSDSSEAIRVLLHQCKLTDNEIKFYGLQWLKDLDTNEENEFGN